MKPNYQLENKKTAREGEEQTTDLLLDERLITIMLPAPLIPS